MKAVISLSGGRDSATVLGLAVERMGNDAIYCIGFDYGSKHPCELESAKKIADYYKVPFQIITINPTIFKGSTSTLLKGNKDVETNKTYDEILKNNPGVVDTYVPARNTLFSAYCLARAESLSQEFNGEKVLIGLGQHADDSGFDKNGVLDYKKAAYPDCSVEFTQAFKRVVEISSTGHVAYWTPFVKMHKWQLIRLGMLLDKPVPYDLCMSCYQPIQDENGNWKEDGICATCLDVKAALEKAKESNMTKKELLKLLKE